VSGFHATPVFDVSFGLGEFVRAAVHATFRALENTRDGKARGAEPRVDVNVKEAVHAESFAALVALETPDESILQLGCLDESRHATAVAATVTIGLSDGAGVT